MPYLKDHDSHIRKSCVNKYSNENYQVFYRCLSTFKCVLQFINITTLMKIIISFKKSKIDFMTILIIHFDQNKMLV